MVSCLGVEYDENVDRIRLTQAGWLCAEPGTYKNHIYTMFCLRINVPVNNFSVILGRLHGFNQY